jgi:hypothetical protein
MTVAAACGQCLTVHVLTAPLLRLLVGTALLGFTLGLQMMTCRHYIVTCPRSITSLGAARLSLLRLLRLRARVVIRYRQLRLPVICVTSMTSMILRAQALGSLRSALRLANTSIAPFVVSVSAIVILKRNGLHYGC